MKIFFSKSLTKKILSPKNVKSFIRTYAKGDNWHELDTKTNNLGYGWFHYSLIRITRPSRVLCIGSRYGFVPAICALACKDNGKGIVDFVDAGFDQKAPEDQNHHWGGVGFWNTPQGRNHFKNFNLSRNIRLHIMTSKEFKLKYPKRTWGYVNIDGNHSSKGITGDFSRFWPALQTHGFMSMHDLNITKLGNLNYGVRHFWHKLKESKKYKLFELPGKFGLGIIQK